MKTETKNQKLEAVLDITRAYTEAWICDDDIAVADEIARNPALDGLTAEDILTYLDDLGAKGDHVSGVWAAAFRWSGNLAGYLEEARAEARAERVAA